MAYMKTNVRMAFILAVEDAYGKDTPVLSRAQITYACARAAITFPAWFTRPAYATPQRGVYDFSKMYREYQNTIDGTLPESDTYENPLTPAPVRQVDPLEPVSEPTQPSAAVSKPKRRKKAKVAAVVEEMVERENYIPEIDDSFIPFGYSSKLRKILNSGVFLPVFIAGLSGNGKTFIVEQLCARAKRELIVVPITIETTEDDLLGGFRLINGETVWSNGPVVEAMERGAVVMLDEVDLASHKIMCLQSIVDGKGVYLKKIGKYVKPEPGFLVVAAANTKGKGKWKGQFVGTNILNEAFLERFGVLFEQNYPSVTIERKILAANLLKYKTDPKEEETLGFISLLVEWANQIRRGFDEDNFQEVISTRRLIHIIKYYSIFRDKLDSVKEGTNRFSDDNKEAFTELYAGLDGDPDLITRLTAEAVATENAEMVQVSI